MNVHFLSNTRARDCYRRSVLFLALFIFSDHEPLTDGRNFDFSNVRYAEVRNRRNLIFNYEVLPTPYALKNDCEFFHGGGGDLNVQNLNKSWTKLGRTKPLQYAGKSRLIR